MFKLFFRQYLEQIDVSNLKKIILFRFCNGRFYSEITQNHKKNYCDAFRPCCAWAGERKRTMVR